MSMVAERSESGVDSGIADLVFDMEDDLAAPLLRQPPEGAGHADKESAGPGTWSFQPPRNPEEGENTFS
jgi:hypothetical protein